MLFDTLTRNGLADALFQMERDMDRVLGRGEGTFGDYPPLNAWSGEEGVKVRAELPGIEAEKLSISVKGELLTIEGEKPSPELKEGEIFLRRESPCGSFSRSLRLPFRANPDEVEAGYSNGLLTITVKRPEELKPRKIEIKTV